MKKKVIITCVSDNPKYLKQVYGLLKSVAKHSPEQFVDLYLLNCSKDVDAIYSFSPKISIFHVDVVNTGNMRCFAASYRSVLVLDSLKKYECPVAWFDSDIIVRKDLSVFWEGFEPNTFKVSLRKSDRKYDLYSGLFGVGYSDATLDFIKDYKHRLYGGNRWKNWGSDQTQLYKSYLNHKKIIIFVDIPKQIHDVGCRLDDSCMWHPKMKRINKEPFKTEFDEYAKGFSFGGCNLT